MNHWQRNLYFVINKNACNTGHKAYNGDKQSKNTTQKTKWATPTTQKNQLANSNQNLLLSGHPSCFSCSHVHVVSDSEWIQHEYIIKTCSFWKFWMTSNSAVSYYPPPHKENWRIIYLLLPSVLNEWFPGYLQR